MRKTITRRFIAIAILMMALRTSASAQTPDHFVLSVDPSVVNISQGSTASFTVTMAADERPVFDLSFSRLPTGVIAETHRGRAGANTIVLTALPTAATGKFSVDITAATGTCSQTQTFTLYVKPMRAMQWEYHVEVFTTAQRLEAAANILGEQSWELVSVVLHEESSVPELIAIFKRTKQ